MAAEIRVDTIKSRSGINTFFFGGDALSFHQNVGIGTTVVANPITVANTGKLAVGFVTPWPYNYWRLKKFNEACH